MALKPGPKRIAVSTGKPDRRQRGSRKVTDYVERCNCHICIAYHEHQRILALEGTPRGVGSFRYVGANGMCDDMWACRTCESPVYDSGFRMDGTMYLRCDKCWTEKEYATVEESFKNED